VLTVTVIIALQFNIATLSNIPPDFK